MSISVVVFIVGFLTACVAQEASISETANSTVTPAQESTTLSTFNETQSELINQGPFNNDTKPKIQEDILSTINENDKELVKQLQLANGDSLSDDYYRSYHFAFGLLSRHKWNFPAALKTLKRLRLWRLSNNINELGTKQPDPKLLELFPYQLTAIDRNGCPVLEVPGGKWLIADYMESKEFVRDALKSFDVHSTQMFEKTRLANKQMLAECNQGVIYLIDASGFATKNIAEPNALSACVRFATVMDNYFPNLYKTVIFLSADPDLAKYITILTPYFGQTSMQFKTFSDNETEQAKDFVYKLIDPEQLSHNYFEVQS